KTRNIVLFLVPCATRFSKNVSICSFNSSVSLIKGFDFAHIVFSCHSSSESCSNIIAKYSSSLYISANISLAYGHSSVNIGALRLKPAVDIINIIDCNKLPCPDSISSIISFVLAAWYSSITARNGSKPSTAPVSRDKGLMYEPSFVCVSNSLTFLTSFFNSGTLETKYINCFDTMLNTILACDLSLAAQNNCRPSLGSLSNKNAYKTSPETKIDFNLLS